MREKRYDKGMKGTQGKEGERYPLLALKENLLFNKTKNNEIQQRGNKESVDL
jgi:hypothetical protein